MITIRIEQFKCCVPTPNGDLKVEIQKYRYGRIGTKRL